MITINEHYTKLQASYLFSDIAKRVANYQQNHQDQAIIKLGIGDVTNPLPRACIEAFHRAVDEMAQESSFRGYGPEQGYEFLREAVIENDFLGYTIWIINLVSVSPHYLGSTQFQTINSILCKAVTCRCFTATEMS